MKKILLTVLFLIVILFFLSGCYLYAGKTLSIKHMVKIPNFTKSYQLQSDEGFPTPAAVSKVIKIFYYNWEMEFGDKDKRVYDTLNSLMIEWRDNPKEGSGYSITGKRVGGVIKGVTLTPGFMWVWKGNYERISATALIHELVHCALWSTNYDHNGDPDHEGHIYHGWTQRHTEFMFKLNYLLADMDI